MKSVTVWALVVLNALLLVSLLGRFGADNTAQAQIRRPGDYLLIPGEVTGASVGLVYVLDTTNGELGAMAYDQTGNQLTSMPRIDLNRVFEGALQQQQQQQRR